ncbi:MAG: SemiSWEET family sugar transporter [Mycoplasmoidaceae bacterium]
MTWYFWIGLIAAACIAVYCMPELIHVIKTKNTCGISIWMLILMLAGDLFFVLNAIGIFADQSNHHNIDAGLPLLLANGIAMIIGIVLLVFKVRSMHYAKVFKTTEKQFCENYESYKPRIKMLKAEQAAAKDVVTPSTPEEPIVG